MHAVDDHEVASDVVVPKVILLETVFEAVPATSEPDVIIVAGLSSGVIPPSPIMMPRMATPPHCPTIGLVSSHKFNSNTLFFYLFMIFVSM